MSKELVYEVATVEGDTVFDAVYEVEPFNAGGRDEPPSGGYAYITEIRRKDGSVVPPDSWQAEGFPPKHIDRLEEQIWEHHGDMERGRYEDEMERRADARREDGI